jgi:hypothetical protein
MGQYSQYSTNPVLGYGGTEQKTYSLQRYEKRLCQQCSTIKTMCESINEEIYQCKYIQTSKINKK